MLYKETPSSSPQPPDASLAAGCCGWELVLLAALWVVLKDREVGVTLHATGI